MKTYSVSSSMSVFTSLDHRVVKVYTIAETKIIVGILRGSIKGIKHVDPIFQKGEKKVDFRNYR